MYSFTSNYQQEEAHEQKERAEAAFHRFLADRHQLWQSLLLDRTLLHRKDAGRWFLTPDGRGGWKPAQSDLHPLALPLPEISQMEYERYGGTNQEPPDELLARYREALLAAWSRVSFLADEPDNPFWNPDALDV